MKSTTLLKGKRANTRPAPCVRALPPFVDRHPTVKMLALSFLILVGMALIAEGWGYPIPKGYIYFAMAFSVVVEMLNLGVRARRQDAVKLRKQTPD